MVFAIHFKFTHHDQHSGVMQFEKLTAL